MKALAVILVLFFVGYIQMFTSGDVSALQGSLWTDARPVIAKTSDITVLPRPDCPTYQQELFVSEAQATRSMCVYGDERLRIATFNEGNSQRVAVGFAFSNTMNLLEGACRGICYYAADTDILVTQQQIGQFGLGLVVFQHASLRIKPVTNPNSDARYTFDTSFPDYEMKNNVGQYIWTPQFSVSANGKWLVAELYNSGVAVLDLDTMAVKQITTEGYQYGRGMDPSEELAVSDDGKSVVVTGQNAGLHVFDIVGSCGQPLFGDLTRLAMTTLCPSSDLEIGVTFANFSTAFRPRFFGNGHELELIVSRWGGSIQRVTYVTNGTPIAHKLKLLSLGDSFTSGEGETDDGYYINGTNQGSDMCHVSRRAYPALIASRLGISDIDAKNIACSGAKIGDIIGSRAEYFGQSNRLQPTPTDQSARDTQIAQELALDEFQPGRTLQALFIKRYNPEVLTIGIGGNDAGLMGKLRTCAMPGTCEWATNEGIKQTAGEIQRLFDSLGSFFGRIAEDAEGSRVFIVGYPDIIEPNGQCDPITVLLMDDQERTFIHKSIQYLNQVIHAAAIKAGFSYVDVEHSFDGTKLCSGANTSSMNGVRTGDDIALVPSLPMLKVIGAETFHPTPSGHRLLADTIVSNYPGMIRNQAIADDVSINPSEYWDQPGITSARSSYATDFAYPDPSDKNQMSVEVPAGTLGIQSAVSIEVRSEPVQLATFTSNGYGGLHGVISLPDSLSEGFHTLHLLGVNRAGEPIDMYQFITIGKLNELTTTSFVEGSSRYSRTVPASTSIFTQQGEQIILAAVSDVLGVQASHTVGEFIKKNVSPPISYMRERVGLDWLAVVLGVFALASLAIVSIILVLKRWAKARS